MSQVLGRGLGSLIPKKPSSSPIQQEQQEESSSSIREQVIGVSPYLIEANPWQPRTSFTENSLRELANSIKRHGFLQPLVVSRHGERFQLIAGERRLRAALNLKLKEVPVIIRQVDDQNKLELALIENLQRQDLNPIEAAQAYQRLINEFNLSQEEAAEKVGKARSSLTNTLRLLSLPTEIQEALRSGRLSEAHAKYLLSLKDPKQQLKVFKDIIRHNLSVADTGREIKNIFSGRKVKLKDEPNDRQKEKTLQSILGTMVKIKRRGRGGQILVDFYSEEELANIIKKINS